VGRIPLASIESLRLVVSAFIGLYMKVTVSVALRIGRFCTSETLKRSSS
jgi:hypothetical protein